MMEKAFIATLRLILFFQALTLMVSIGFSLRAFRIADFSWVDLLPQLLLLVAMVLCWLMPRKVLKIERRDFADLTIDTQRLAEKLPQLIVFAIGFFLLLSNLQSILQYSIKLLSTGFEGVTIASFGAQQFWMLFLLIWMLGIPFLAMRYCKLIARFFIK